MRLASLDCLAENVGVQSIVISELEFYDIERQVFVTDLVEIAHNTALDQRPEALDCVRMNRADDMLTNVVVNGLMREPILQSVIAVIGVCAKQAHAGRDGFADETFQCWAVSAIDDAGDDVAFAPDCAHDSGFERVARTASRSAFLVPMPVFVASADVGLVNLDDAAKLLNIFDERDADFMTHEPSSRIAPKAHVPIDLERAHSLFADQHQVNYSIPVFERLICVLKDCAGQMREAIASVRSALIALPMPRIALQFWRDDCAAARAANAFRPTARNEVLNAIVFGLKERVELRCGQLMDGLRFRLLPAGHDGSPRLIGASLHV